MKCSDEELRQNVREWVVATIKAGRLADKGRVARSQLDVRFGYSAAARDRLSQTLNELVERGELYPCQELRSVDGEEYTETLYRLPGLLERLAWAAR